MNDSAYNHPDVIDQASSLEHAATQQAIYQVQRACKPVQTMRPNGTFEFEDCEDCGNEIGLERLKVAIQNQLCVHCATVRERLARR